MVWPRGERAAAPAPVILVVGDSLSAGPLNIQVMAVPEVELVHEHQRHSQAGIWSTSGQTHLRSMVRFFTKFGVPWVRRPHRSRMKAAYLRWRRQAVEQAVSHQSDASA